MKTTFACLTLIATLAACGGGDATGLDGSGRSVAVSAPFTTVRVGQALQLSAAVTDAGGSVVAGAPVAWSSSAREVASVSTTGLVSAVGPGPVTVTATSGRVSGSLALTVAPATGTGTARVTMPGFSFTPFTTTIPVGGTVNFEFPTLAHNVIFARRQGAPADIQTTSNRVVPRTFPTAGSFPYDCTLHPGMVGTVEVR